MPPKYYYSRPVVHSHIILKPHHKKLIIGGSSLMIILLIALSVFSYMIFTKQELYNSMLNKKINDLKTETNININTLSESLIQSNKDFVKINSQLGIISEEFTSLKASAGADFSAVIETTVTGVVTVRTDISQGTGFLISNDGYVVTNYHVVENAKAATIITSDNQNHKVSILGYNSDLDIALLRIEGNYTPLKLDNSDNVQVGEKVIAIGNPLGLQFSVSQGIVSAIHRTGPNDLNYYIQTDAALNPGNSGGPLINTDGKVIGINNFKAGNSESLGFALESNHIKEAVNEIYQKEFAENLI
ncbi:MAG: trypsin-like peptidase domain-containing protein [Nanoarchaeota archaeon]